MTDQSGLGDEDSGHAEQSVRAELLGEVLRAVGRQRGESQDKVGALVDRELRDRHITDATEQERQLLINAAISPELTAWRGLLGQVRTFGELFGRRRRRWTYPPNCVTSLTSWGDDQREIPVVFRTTELTESRAVIERLLAELSPRPADLEPSSDDAEPCDVWITQRAASPDAPITVNIGQHEIAVVPDQHREVAGALIREHGGRSNAVEILGELRGADIDSGSLTIYLLDPP